MTPATDDPAKRRFQIMVAFRVYGLVLIALGLVIWKTHWVGVTHPQVGRITVAAGVGVLTVIPALLRRQWRRGR